MHSACLFPSPSLLVALSLATFADGTIVLNIAISNCISEINGCLQSVPLHRLRGNNTAIPKARDRHPSQGWAIDKPLLPLEGMYPLMTTGYPISVMR